MCGHMGTSGVQPKDIIIFLYTFYTFRKTLNHFRLFPPSFLFRLTVFLRLFPPSFLLSFLLHVPGIFFSSLRFSGKTTHTHTTFLFTHVRYTVSSERFFIGRYYSTICCDYRGHFARHFAYRYV
jgi:hypothetical protein